MDVNYGLINGLQNYTGMTGLFSIIIVILSIILVWFVLQEVKWEAFFVFQRVQRLVCFKYLLQL